MKKNILIVQSGGPTAVMNATLQGIVDYIETNYSEMHVLGALGGIEGVLNEDIISLSSPSPYQHIKQKPGAILGTSRYRPSEEQLQRCCTIFQKWEIRYVCMIGGNGTMRLTKRIGDYCPDTIIFGFPQTIDNDIFGTTIAPGYLSSAKYLTETLHNMSHDILSYRKRQTIEIVETMGRTVGWLAASCQQYIHASNEKIHTILLIPEVSVSYDQLLNEILYAIQRGQSIVCIVAEGVVAYPQKRDETIGQTLKRLLQTSISTIDIKYTNPGILQRCTIQSLSPMDVDLAYKQGQYGIQHMMKGKRNQMISNYFLNGKALYQTVTLSQVIHKDHEVPKDWYDDSTLQMNEQFDSFWRNMNTIYEEEV